MSTNQSSVAEPYVTEESLDASFNNMVARNFIVGALIGFIAYNGTKFIKYYIAYQMLAQQQQ